MKIKQMRKMYITVIIALLTVAAMLFAVSCGGDNASPNGNTDAVEYTISFDTDGGTEIQPIKATAGTTVVSPAAPEKDGYVFVGWYATPERDGEPVSLPTVMPSANVTYYAKFVLIGEDTYKVIYEFNLGTTPHKNITNSEGVAGSSITVKDGAAYNVTGYMFLGWTSKIGGTISLSGSKAEGQYDAGDTIVLGDKDVTLYAQWARIYTDARENSDDKICVYEPLIGNGLGAAILVRSGKENKLGFVTAADETQSGYAEFTFYFEASEGGDLEGRLNVDDQTYMIADGMQGEYVYYDYIENTTGGYVLALDGFGYAVVIGMVGSQTAVSLYGYYEYDKTYGDYLFAYDDTYGNSGLCYFMLEVGAVSGTEFIGRYRMQGGESGSYLWYDNGELYNYRLDLNGYGTAVLYSYDPTTEVTETVAQGVYRGTERYEDYYGEWIFTSNKGSSEEFKFVLNMLVGDTENIPVYIEYNAEYDKTFTAKDDNGTLTIDGYGGAIYSVAGYEYIGNCTVGNDTLITCALYNEDGESIGVTYFNVDWSALTFTVNTEGFVIDGTVLTAYHGTSQIVVIPDDIDTIADNAFNDVLTDVSLVSVTIPASVKSIGNKAFQNSYTLRRAIFYSQVPVEIDWSAENDPFRWPSGSFIIVVPEGYQDAYKAAWQNCPYDIKGSVEVTLLPEFEIVDGVLKRYNKQPDSADVLDIKIPDEVTEIAAGVFMGCDFIRSIDLNNVTVIGEQAFYGCENLVTVKFTEVKVIGEGAFVYCVSLSSSGTPNVVELPKIVTLGASAFMGCESLSRVVLGVSLAEIGNMAFRECQIYEDGAPLFIELMCTTAPRMGAQITAGNLSIKFQVQNVAMALSCFGNPYWNNYCSHLYIESGDEKGVYICGIDLLELDGRAMFQSSTIMMYEVNGNVITFYEYDNETYSYETYVGSITADGISVTFGSVAYSFVPLRDEMTYVSADGKYTLVCNPLDLLPQSYDGFTGYASVTFNGTPALVYISGYTTKIIRGFTDSDGKSYDFSISFDGNTLVYKRTVAETYIRDITCDDGSVLNIHITGSLIYVFGELKISVGKDSQGKDIYLAFSEGGTIAINTAQNVYTFSVRYLNNRYNVTVTLSDDATTFTYTYTVD